MFQGESAGSVPARQTTGNDNRTTLVYVDAPRHETMEEWQARVSASKLGCSSAKLIHGKTPADN